MVDRSAVGFPIAPLTSDLNGEGREPSMPSLCLAGIKSASVVTAGSTRADADQIRCHRMQKLPNFPPRRVAIQLFGEFVPA